MKLRMLAAPTIVFVFTALSPAHAQDAEALYNQAKQLYKNGDFSQAASVSQKACDGGGADGCSGLGVAYENGQGVAKDENRAVQLYQKACDGGSARGCTNLGLMYSNGRGVAKDENRAVQLFQKTCDGGDARACTYLGSRYVLGRGVGKDVNRAVQLYQKGCEGGDANGCSILGVAYENGQGVGKDVNRAAHLYQKACDGGFATGCTSLSRLMQAAAATPAAASWVPAARSAASSTVAGGASQARVQDATRQLPDIVSMLEAAKQKRIALSRQEWSLFKSKGDSDLKWHVDRCNKNNYDLDHGVWNTSKICDRIVSYFDEIAPEQGELAAQRACAFVDNSGERNLCAKLGAFYEKRGRADLALQVYLRAPNCNQSHDRVADSMACLNGAARILKQTGDLNAELPVVRELCTTFSDPMACERYNQLGGSANVQAAKVNFDANQQAEREDRKERNERQQEDAQRKIADREAMFDAVERGLAESTLRISEIELAGTLGSNSSGGSGGTPKHSPAAQQSTTTTQTQPTKQTSSQTPSSGATNSATNNAGNYGVKFTSSTSQYVASLPTYCVSQFWDAQYYNWLSLQNNCGQAIHVQFVSVNRDGNLWGSADLAPGAKSNTGASQADAVKAGGIVLYVCPEGSLSVDNTTDQQVGTHAGNVAFRCKKQ
jgi:TPR repeat protein